MLGVVYIAIDSTEWHSFSEQRYVSTEGRDQRDMLRGDGAVRPTTERLSKQCLDG